MTVPGAGAGRTGKGIAHVFALAGQEALINGHGARFGVAGQGNRFRKWCAGAGRPARWQGGALQSPKPTCFRA